MIFYLLVAMIVGTISAYFHTLDFHTLKFKYDIDQNSWMFSRAALTIFIMILWPFMVPISLSVMFAKHKFLKGNQK